MATAARLPLTPEEYLGTSYKPDCDFVDGQLQERNVGEDQHALFQMAVILWFGKYMEQWHLFPLPEMRIQVGPSRFRVADICVVQGTPPVGVLDQPPLIVIEILSPEDRVHRYKERVEDYRRMEISNIWVIDPITCDGFDCSTGNWNRTEVFRVNGTEIFMPVRELAIKRDVI